MIKELIHHERPTGMQAFRRSGSTRDGRRERLAQTLDFAPRYSVEEGIDLYIEEL